MKRFLARTAGLAALAILAAGCGNEVDGHFSIQLVWGCKPAFSDIESKVTSYCVSVQTQAGSLIGPNCSSTLAGFQVTLDQSSGPVSLIVEGLDSASNPVFRGTSVPVDLTSGVDNTLAVPVAPVGKFLLVAGSVSGCSKLPFTAADHTATVFPSGHVLVVGSSIAGITATQAAFLIDPVTRRSATLATPGSLYRSLHSATLMDDGRVAILGGQPTGGVVKLTDLQVLSGAKPLLSPYDRSVDYPGLLGFQALPAQLPAVEVLHDAALFYGDQILINDGNSQAQMFLGATNDVGAATSNPAGAFPINNYAETIVPLDRTSGVLLGGVAGHAGLVKVDRNNRTVAYTAYSGTFTLRNRPLGLFLKGGKVAFVGGIVNKLPGENPVLIADPATQQVVAVPVPGTIIPPDQDFTVTQLPDGSVLVAGGSSTTSGFVPGSTIVVSSHSGTWTISQGPNLIYPRAGHTASLLPDGQVLMIGGRSASASVSNDVVGSSAEVIAF